MCCNGDILVVVRDASRRDFIAEALGDEGYSVYTTDNPEQARTTLVVHSVRLLICDLYAAGIPCTQLMAELRAIARADIPVLIIVDNPQETEQFNCCRSLAPWQCLSI